MTDEAPHGTRDKRGDWRPARALTLPPLFETPLAVGPVLGWLKGYLGGWNLAFLVLTLGYWLFVLPAPETMARLTWGWPLRLLAVNMAGIALFFGAFELRYYVRRAQGGRFKYNGKFPAEQRSDVFWFGRQDLDNALRSLLVTVPIGTAIEVLVLWLMASGAVPSISPAAHPIWFAVILLISPILHEAQFFFIHRAIHWGPLYRLVHSVHHNSVNPSPWSSMSMHPVEGALYFSTLLWHLVLWSCPILVVWQWNLAAYGAVVGHIGFDRLEVGGDRAVESHAYAHYLHHKHFEVNYCDDGALPWDKWFGTWHDGTKAGDALMQARYDRKKARMNAARDART